MEIEETGWQQTRLTTKKKREEGNGWVKQQREGQGNEKRNGAK